VTWAKRGEIWRGLDVWGTSIGVFEVAGGAGNEATTCYELALLPPDERSALYVSPDWAGHKSFAWVPGDSERASLAQAVAHTDALFPPREEAAAEASERARFFQSSNDGGKVRLAVVGGTVLSIFEFTEGRWITAFMDTTLYLPSYQSAAAYRPIAILDMNGDESPEIVVSESAGQTFWDAVIESRGENAGWREMAVSVGGSTL
jgi:hypothetical protein